MPVLAHSDMEVGNLKLRLLVELLQLEDHICVLLALPQEKVARQRLR